MVGLRRVLRKSFLERVMSTPVQKDDKELARELGEKNVSTRACGEGPERENLKHVKVQSSKRM